jgi:hypothetical protein
MPESIMEEKQPQVWQGVLDEWVLALPIPLRLLRVVLQFGSALRAAIPVLPIIVSALLILADNFGTRWITFLPDQSAPVQGWLPVWAVVGIVAVILALLSWLLIAAFLAPQATPQGGNLRCYGQVNRSYQEQVARCGLLANSGSSAALPRADAEAQTDFYAALNAYQDQVRTLGESWTSQIGYITLWNHVHRAEEAWIQLASLESLESMIVDAKLRLTDTTVPGSQDSMSRLAQFEEELTRAKHLSNSSLRVLRLIVNRINEFHDSRFAALVDVRNFLLTASVLISSITLGLLMLALMAGVDNATLNAAAGIYLFGAVCGLLGRLYREVPSNAGIDEYGFSFSNVRLLTTPILSGLAAVGGVLVVMIAMLTGMSLSQNGLPLDQLFNFSKYPIILIIAGGFGLAPNLFVNLLQQQSERYIEDLAKLNSSGVVNPPPSAQSHGQATDEANSRPGGPSNVTESMKVGQ